MNVLLAVRLLKKPSAFEELICTKRSMKEEEEVEVVQEETVEEWSGDRKQRRKMQFEKMLKRIDSIAKRNAGKDRTEERGSFPFCHLQTIWSGFGLLFLNCCREWTFRVIRSCLIGLTFL